MLLFAQAEASAEADPASTRLYSVSSADGRKTWHTGRETAVAVAAAAGLASSAVRPMGAPEYTPRRYGVLRDANSRSRELTAGLAKIAAAMVPGQPLDLAYLFEMIADAVVQCGFSGPVSLDLSATIYPEIADSFGSLAGFTLTAKKLPCAVRLPLTPTVFGSCEGIDLSVCRTSVSSLLRYYDPADGLIFLSTLPPMAGLL